MTLSANLIRELQARGVAAETILDAVLAVEDERRAKERARVAKYRNNNKDRTSITRTPRSPRTPLSPETRVSPEPLSQTQPLSPQENPPKGGQKKPAKPFILVDVWTPCDSLEGFATEHGFTASNFARELDTMRDWARGKGEKKQDWDATARNWLRRASENRRPNGTGPPSKPLSGSAKLVAALNTPFEELYARNRNQEPAQAPVHAIRNGSGQRS